MLKTKLTIGFIMLFAASVVQAQITAQQAIKAMGRGINMGNTLDAPNEGEWAGPAQEYYFEMYKEAGFKTVRIPITWGKHISTASPYTINATFLNRVEQIVDWALDRDMYVIINAHHDSWIKDDYANQKNRFDSLWAQVSRRFKDKPENLFFEILNEPHGAITLAQVNELNKRVLGIIRQTNPTRIVVYSGAGWANSPDLLSAAVPATDDPYLMGYFHSYDPWTFAGEATGTWGSTSDIQAMKDKLAGVRTWSEQKNIPVLIGEFGAQKNCEYNSRMFYYATYVEQAMAYHMAFTVWDDDGDFQALQRSQKTWNDLKDIIIYSSDSSATGLKLQVVDDSAVQLSWTSRATEGALKKVIIERRALTGGFTPIAELKQTSGTVYIDRDAVGCATGYYRVKDVYQDDTIPSYPISIFNPGINRQPYDGVVSQIPGTIEAENFDEGCEMLTFHDTDFKNDGNVYRSEGIDIKKSSSFYYIFNTSTGEWMEYTINVNKSAIYNVSLYASANEDGGLFQLQIGNLKTKNLKVLKTANAITFEPITTQMELTEGAQVCRLIIKNSTAFNIDKLVFEEASSVIDNDEDRVTLYPNPANDQLEIRINNLSQADVRIYNATGQLMMENQIMEQKTNINVSSLKAGVYLVVISDGSHVIKSTFVKQ